MKSPDWLRPVWKNGLVVGGLLTISSVVSACHPENRPVVAQFPQPDLNSPKTVQVQPSATPTEVTVPTRTSTLPAQEVPPKTENVTRLRHVSFFAASTGQFIKEDGAKELFSDVEMIHIYGRSGMTIPELTKNLEEIPDSEAATIEKSIYYLGINDALKGVSAQGTFNNFKIFYLKARAKFYNSDNYVVGHLENMIGAGPNDDPQARAMLVMNQNALDTLFRDNADELGYTYVDPKEEIKYDPKYYRDSLHLNPVGEKKLCGFLTRKMRETKNKVSYWFRSPRQSFGFFL